MSFVHLHNHSEYSLLDGAIRIDDIVKKAIEYEMPAVAITDHGNMFAAVKFFKAANKSGIKPIIGEEFYVNPAGMDSKKIEMGAPQSGFHLTLLAQNEKGWKNLIRLSSESYTRGFYYKPKIDMDLLRNHSEGVIALSGCLAGQIPNLLRKGMDTEAKKMAIEFLDIFGTEHFYIELMNHFIDDELLVLPKLIQLARDLGIGTVATNDAHYVNREDAKYHDILLAVGTKQEVADESRKLRFLPNTEMYFKSPQEMKKLFSEKPEAITNTLKIADMIDFKLDIGNLHFPEYPLPEGQTIQEYLRYESEQGLKQRYKTIPDSHKHRLEHELKIINDMGFPGYFAICADFTRQARKLDIRVGPGRGSGGGSIVAYALGITDFDPMRFDLLFERFLNPERKSMPDFDIDFADDKREEVIDYVKEKYGEDCVAHVISFGTLKAKAVIKDVGRAMGKDFAQMNILSKLVPDGKTISDAMEESKELCDFIKEQNLTDTIDAAKMLEGLPRHTSMHAAGIVITPGPTTQYVPLYKTNKNDITTQFDKNFVEDLGLLKMDFLGLRTLTVVTESLHLIEKKTKEKIDMNTIDDTDQSVYELFDKGETVALFQFESSGMKRYLMQLHPDSIEDLIAMNALYRPGPMDNIPTYIKRKHGEEESDFYHENFKPILETTHGIMVYQEQIMLVAQKIAGFSLGEADILRRAMGYKKVDVMEEQREIFIERSVQNGYKQKFANDMFEIILKFAGYGFNKSHSAAYAVLAYQTAYLKRYYPVEFMTANLTSEIGTNDRINILMSECKRMGIEVLPPCVNKSFWNFQIEGDSIRFALGPIKNIGREMIKLLANDREKNGDFTGFYNFCERVVKNGLNQRSLEFLIYAGALDVFGHTRCSLCVGAERGIKFGQESAGRDNQQLTFFDMGLMDEKDKYPEMQILDEWVLPLVLENEAKSLGFYLSGHPLDEWKFILKNYGSREIQSSMKQESGSNVSLCGLLSSWRVVTTKKGKTMVLGTIEDSSQTAKFVIFSRQYEALHENFNAGDVVIANGTVEDRGEKQLKVDTLVGVKNILTNFGKRLNILLDINQYKIPKDFENLVKVLESNKGNGELVLHFVDEDGSCVEKIIARRFSIEIDQPIYRELEKEFGSDNLWFDISNFN